jgi:hypothetical protein
LVEELLSLVDPATDGVQAAGILPERGLTSLEQKKNIFGIVNPRENMPMSNPSLSETGHYEHACDQAIAMCNGNLRSTIKALIMANEYLEAELEELHTAIAAGCAPARAPHAGSNAA